jgi:transposase
MAAQITGGVDTHLDVHVVAALDELGALVGVESFPATPAGYRALFGWLGWHGEVVVVGVEGTGSYGAGLARHLQHEGVAVVVEVDRPNRQRRRRQGKSDPHDAVTAARAAQAGDALGVAKLRDGNVEAIRVLRVVRGGAKRDRTRAINQMRSLVSTAPDDLRQQRRGLTITKLVRRAAALRPGGRSDVTAATRLALRTLARRVLELDSEVAALTRSWSRWLPPPRPTWLLRSVSAPTPPAPCSSPPERTQAVSATNAPSPGSAAPPHSTRHPASSTDTDSAAPVTAKPTRHRGGS